MILSKNDNGDADKKPRSESDEKNATHVGHHKLIALRLKRGEELHDYGSPAKQRGEKSNQHGTAAKMVYDKRQNRRRFGDCRPNRKKKAM